jgi:hypothetical protein
MRMLRWLGVGMREFMIERQGSLKDHESYDFSTVDVKEHVRIAVSPA